MRVHYEFHPYHDMELEVVRIDKDRMVHVMGPRGVVIGVPLWMTDEDACKKVKKASNPCCSVEALQRLRKLVDCLKADTSHSLATTDSQQTPTGTTFKKTYG